MSTLTNKYESLRWMADAAWRRFDSRRSYEWKANFALWAAFGSITGFLIGRPALDTKSCVFVTVITLFIWVGYFTFWAPWLHSSNARDQQTAYHWENALRRMINERLPSHLEPPHDWPSTSLTVTAGDEPERSAKGRFDYYKRIFRVFWCEPSGIWGNASALSQLITTTLLWVLVLGAVWLKPSK